MSDFLVFQLYGPLASWGNIAVGESRHSDIYPSKSAVMGLVAAALGIRRCDDVAHKQLSTSYGYGVKVISPGTLMRDYHTTQAPPRQKKVVHYTRRDELNASKLGTILSAREYRCDSCAVVALWALVPNPPYSLEQLAKALSRPKFVLYLGRKSCPLGLPLQAQVFKADTLKIALDADLFLDGKNFMPEQTLVRYCWDKTAHPGMKSDQQISRYDAVLSRKRWQFETRLEEVYFGKEA
jgi:CRISPR system Cascade subunit CasD